MQNANKRLIEMQLALEKGLSSLDVNQITVGINEASQSPHDIIQSFSQGCQTDLLMIHDVSTETRKITLDSSEQCEDDTLEMYTQTETPFTKSKNVQTDFIKSNCFTQTNKLKSRHAFVQTASKLYSDKCEQIAKIELDKVDTCTETEMTTVYSQGTLTENIEVYDTIDLDATDICADRNCNDESNLVSSVPNQKTKEKSESPPLSPDKSTPGPSTYFSFPFVSLFRPSLVLRLPTIGTYYFYPTNLCCFIFSAVLYITVCP